MPLEQFFSTHSPPKMDLSDDILKSTGSYSTLKFILLIAAKLKENDYPLHAVMTHLMFPQPFVTEDFVAGTHPFYTAHTILYML